ncbi:MAG: hypothetical protein PHT44_00640 [Candidatus Portnoybacteria bacterium]|nr:hypothetical protein [Candidatus Portnoybacteria bacterium]MDD4982878.1 hypothetical protein [Candidatus Portnoybacteria bacterium]
MKKRESTTKTSTQKKYDRFLKDVFGAAAKRAGVGKNGKLRLMENSDELQARITDILQGLTANGRFADEEVRSDFGYVSGYDKPKDISEQLRLLRQFFPGFTRANERFAKRPLPGGAEGWFAVPKWEDIAPTYNEAFGIVLDLIGKSRNGKFYNWRENQLGPRHLRQSAKTAGKFRRMGKEQRNCDFLIFAAQLGFMHRGCSIRRALETMSAEEFGLDGFAGAVILLTHQERLKHVDELYMDLPGDEVSSRGDGFFQSGSSFHFHMGKIKYASHYVANANPHYGSASGFSGK